MVNEFLTLEWVTLRRAECPCAALLPIVQVRDIVLAAPTRAVLEVLQRRGSLMRNKPGPRKKPGERYLSGDLKPAIAPALWGRARDLGGAQLKAELGRLCFHRELTETQASAGFLIADIYRHSVSAESAMERGDATAAAKRGALDALLSEYPAKVSQAVIELCVSNLAVDWKLRPQIRQLLDHVADAFAFS